MVPMSVRSIAVRVTVGASWLVPGMVLDDDC